MNENFDQIKSAVNDNYVDIIGIDTQVELNYSAITNNAGIISGLSGLAGQNQFQIGQNTQGILDLNFIVSGFSSSIHNTNLLVSSTTNDVFIHSQLISSATSNIAANSQLISSATNADFIMRGDIDQNTAEIATNASGININGGRIQQNADSIAGIQQFENTSFISSTTQLVTLLSGLTNTGPTNPHSIILDAGIFDLGPLQMVIPPNVAIRGQGCDSTRLLGMGSIHFGPNTEIQNLGLEMSGPLPLPPLLIPPATFVKMHSVDIRLLNGNQFKPAIEVQGTLVVHDSKIATGGTVDGAVMKVSSGNVSLRNSTLLTLNPTSPALQLDNSGFAQIFDSTLIAPIMFIGPLDSEVKIANSQMSLPPLPGPSLTCLRNFDLQLQSIVCP